MSEQDFWLRSLSRADRLNRWTFESFREHLGDNVLEVGCGQGTYTRLIGAHASRLVAIDIDQDFVTIARNTVGQLAGVEILCKDVMDCEWNAEFDTVVMLDVMEHLEDEGNLLHRLFASLRPGGHLIVKVPALPHLFGALDSAIGHHRRYTRPTLGRALKAAGFEVARQWYFNIAAIPGWWWNGRLLRRAQPPSGQIAFFDALVPILARLERWIGPPVGLSLFAVARRPLEKSATA